MKKIIILNFLFLGVVLFSGNVFAQNKTVKTFTLKEAVEYARKNNYSLKNNQLDIQASEKKVKEVLASGLPQINAFGNYTNNTTIASNVINFGGQTVILKFGQPYVATGNISASQLIFDGGFLMGVKASKEFVELSKINLKRSEIEAEVAVSKAYYLAILLQTKISMTDTNLISIEKNKKDLEQIYAKGMAEKVDLDRINLQYSSTLLQRERDLSAYNISLMILELQLGMDVKDSIVLTDKLTDLYKNAKTPVVESVTDYTKRTEYQMLNQQIKLYNFEKKSYQLGYLPSLNAVAASQRNSFGSDFSKLGNIWYPGTYWGLNLSVPIFDGLRKSAKIQQTNINLQKAENDKKNLENGISQSIVAAKNGFELASKQVIILEENMKLAQEIYNQVEIKFKNGMSSSTNLVNAQTDLATARQNYLATIFDYFSNQIDLRRAVGDIK